MDKIQKEKFDKLISKNKPEWVKDIDYIESNRDWLELSCKIAIKINSLMREKNISKDELVRETKIPIARLNLILKGNCNLTLKGIAKLEKALDSSLVEVFFKKRYS